MRAQHEDLSFHLCLGRKRDMHRHLVAVKVGIESRTNQGVDFDRLAFDENRLKGLDSEPMQRRGSV